MIPLRHTAGRTVAEVKRPRTFQKPVEEWRDYKIYSEGLQSPMEDHTTWSITRLTEQNVVKLTKETSAIKFHFFFLPPFPDFAVAAPLAPEAEPDCSCFLLRP